MFHENGGRSIAFSPTEARVRRSIGPLARTRYTPLAQCRRLRILEKPAPETTTEGTVVPPDNGRLAFDAGERTVLFGRGMSDAEARAVFRYLIKSVPRFAESHERS